jgi:PAS domain S-box-containing protein
MLEQEKRHAEELARYSTGLEQLVFERTGKLAESERKYRSLVENIPDVVWTTGQKGNTVFISPNIESVYGYTSQEIYEGGEMLWLGRIHLEDIERVREAYGLLLTGKGHFDIEYRIQRKDGKWIWLHDRAVATYQRDGVIYADGVFSDITDRKRAEEELRVARERLDHVITYNPAVIYSGKPFADHSDFLLTYVSERVVSMFGFEPQDFIGHPEF